MFPGARVIHLFADWGDWPPVGELHLDVGLRGYDARHGDQMAPCCVYWHDLSVTSRHHIKSGVRWLLAALGLLVLYGTLYFGFHYSVAYMLVFLGLPFAVALSCALVSFRRASRLKKSGRSPVT